MIDLKFNSSLHKPISYNQPIAFSGSSLKMVSKVNNPSFLNSLENKLTPQG